MQRRSFLRNTGLTLASLALLNKESLASFLADPAWKIKMLTDNIGIFTEKGGTIMFLLTKKGMVVVDSQFPDTAPHLIEELKKKSEKPFRYLINTHHHGDHSSGNIAFKDIVEHVVAHENSKANQLRVAAEQKTAPEKVLAPDITYGADGWKQKIAKETIRTYYFGAGHTNGDSIIHFEKGNVAHLGDLLFNRRHPYVDKGAGANINNWIVLLDKTIATFDKNTQFVCGHSGEGFDILVKPDDLKAFGDYLGNVLKFTEGEIRAGKSKDEILKAKEIPGSPEWKGSGIERPLGAAYTELTMK
ncbi:MAG TPA: MBL fold metallo-hydrolase [Ferruginibacter sp.]|nr:MBL fold metallo-hydrolase [Chitinophagaceae bacterium]HRI25546.1 MBL fold metallo-hydrolase [Ferruginibacter sp.]